MHILLVLLLLVIGLVLIVKGGDIFVDASVWMARISHVREMIIGATIVSVGTTLPEVLTSTIATVRGVSLGGDGGYYALALSNAIGSMMCNSGLILAIVLLVRPPRYDRDTFKRPSIYVMLISVFLVLAFITNSRISIAEGVILLLFFLLFVVGSVRDAIKGMDEVSPAEMELYRKAREQSTFRMILSFIIGAISIGVGAMLLVDNARTLALSIGISEQLVGVTLVALGTSLPELVTNMTALRRRSQDIGVGNIMGAHVINGTLIVGLVAIISRGGMVVDAMTRNISVYVMLGIMAILILPTWARGRFCRWQGLLMLAVYLGYIGYNVLAVTFR